MHLKLGCVGCPHKILREDGEQGHFSPQCSTAMDQFPLEIWVSPSMLIFREVVKTELFYIAFHL